MNIKEIVKQYLEVNNYDGLWNADCGCSLSDLMVCDEPDLDYCQPGYNRPEEDYEYHIGPEKGIGG